MFRWFAVFALAVACGGDQQRKQVVTPITHREVRPMAPRPEPVPTRASSQGAVADPPTKAPEVPPLNPGTNGASPASEPDK